MRQWRIGLGPVFSYEWLIASRRWQMFGLRAALILLLLFAFSFAWWMTCTSNQGMQVYRQRHLLADIGENSFYSIIGTLLAIVLLAAPAATAGAICRDKITGALLQLMTTDLRDGEIVLGKYAGRLIPVLGLVLASAPVLFMAALLGGIDPNALIGAYLVVLGCTLLGCSLAIFLSVFGSKAHEVLLVTYLVWICALMSGPMYKVFAWYLPLGTPPTWFDFLNPFWIAFAPYMSPGATDLTDNLIFLLGCGGVSAVLLVTTWGWMRKHVLLQAARVARSSPRRAFFRDLLSWTKPSLQRRPLLWWEWHRRRPTIWVRLVWGSYGLMTLVFTLMAIVQIFVDSGRNEWPVILNAFQVSIGLLLLSVSSVTALAEERGRGSLDVLFTTPLSTPAIIWSKWQSAFHLVPWFAFLPSLIGVAMLLRHGPRVELLFLVALIVAVGAFQTSVGLALATWVPRFGRAVCLGVGVYIAVQLVPILATFALERQGGNSGSTLASMAFGSPFYGMVIVTLSLGDRNIMNDLDVIACAMMWLTFYSGSALVLYLLTLASFNRCLGRAPERSRRPPIPRLATESVSPLAPAIDLAQS